MEQAPLPEAPRRDRKATALLWLGRLRGVALVLVMLAGGAYFLHAVGGHYPIEKWLFWRYAGYWLLCAVWSLACVSSGHLVVKRVLGRTLPVVEHLPIAFAVGVYLFFAGMFVGGLLGLYGAAFFVLLPTALVAAGAVPLARTVRRYARHVRFAVPRAPRARWWTYPIVALGLLGVGMLYFSILTPNNVAFDSRWQHLALAEHYVAEGAVQRFPEGYYVGTSPHLASFVYTWAFMLPKASLFDFVVLSAHLEFTAFLWTLVGVVAVVRRLVPNSRASVAWAARFAFPGVFLYDSSLCAGADHMAALFAAPIYCLLIRAYKDVSPRVSALLAVVLAGAFMTKYTGALVLLATPAVAIGGRCLWLAGASAYRRARRRPDPATGHWLAGPLVILAVGLALTAPQWAKNWAWYGDPLYPLLHKSLALRPWTPDSGDRFDFGFIVAQLWRPERSLAGVEQSLRALLTFSFVPNDWPKFHGKVPVFGSLLTLLLFTLPFLKGQKRVIGIFAGVHLGIFIWYWTHHQDRYLQALVPWMAAGVAAVVVLIWRTNVAAKAAVVGLFALQIIWGGDVYFIPGHAMIRSPVKVVADLLSTGYRKDFDSRDKNFAPFSDVAKVLPEGAKVLVHEYHMHLGLAAASVNDYPVNQGGISYGRLETPRAVHDLLRGYGVSHLMWITGTSKLTDTIAGDLVFFGYATRFGAKATSYGSMTLAEMRAEPPPEEAPGDVAALTCGKAPSRGLYHLAQLHVPVYGPLANKYPKPLRAGSLAGTDDEALTEAASYLIFDPGCKKPMPFAGPKFRKAAKRGKLELWVRRSGAPVGLGEAAPHDAAAMEAEPADEAPAPPPERPSGPEGDEAP